MLTCTGQCSVLIICTCFPSLASQTHWWDMPECWVSIRSRVAALTSQNHMTNYFRKAKEHGIQWQLNRSYSLTCTTGHVVAQFNQHGNCATAKVDTVVLGKCQAACISKITVELTISCLAVLWAKCNITESVADVLRPVTSNTAALYSIVLVLSCIKLNPSHSLTHTSTV